MTADRFARVALTAVQNNPDCSTAIPVAIQCLHEGGKDGLLPDGKGAIMPTQGEGNLAAMVQGLVAPAKRRGSGTNLVANVVYDGEPFEVLCAMMSIVHRRELGKVTAGASSLSMQLPRSRMAPKSAK